MLRTTANHQGDFCGTASSQCVWSLVISDGATRASRRYGRATGAGLPLRWSGMDAWNLPLSDYPLYPYASTDPSAVYLDPEVAEPYLFYLGRVSLLRNSTSSAGEPEGIPTTPTLYQVPDPFGRLLARQTGAVRIKSSDVIAASESLPASTS